MPASPCDAHYYQPIDISVVIPFFNPAANIEDCLASMVDQTLDPSRFEVVLVDDGSTDSSPARVDEWVARHPALFSVRRIPASGWPGRPRNVGIDAARGRYIQFVDSDDTMAPRALQRILDVANESDADVVIGKLSSDFRGIHHALFRETLTGLTLADPPIMQNLTVCKLFRRDLLLAHDIRFADGPRHAEDQHFCVQAYVHAKSVAVIGDTACYFYRRRRTAGRNLGDTYLIPADYTRDLGQLLDVSDHADVVPAARANVQDRIYRTHLLGRLRGAAMLEYDADYRRDLIAEVRRFAAARISPDIESGLATVLRVQSLLLREGDVEQLLDYARRLETIRMHAVCGAPAWVDGRLVVDIEAMLRIGDEPLRLEPLDAGWVLPHSLAPGVSAADRRLGPADDLDVDLDLATISRRDSQSWSTTEGMTLQIDDAGMPHVRGRVMLDPATLIGGEALTTGRWDLRLRVSFAGLRRQSPLRPAPEELPDLASWIRPGSDAPRAVTAYWTAPSPTLALDVDEWAHPLHAAVADPATTAISIEGRRDLLISTTRLQGSTGSTQPAELILEPIGAAEIGVTRCDAALEIRPDGTSMRATIPRLPSGPSGWAVSLRIGEIGGTPPQRLPVVIGQGRLSRLTINAI